MANGINALIALGGQRPPIDFLESKARAAQTLTAEESALAIPEERAWKRESRGFLREEAARLRDVDPILKAKTYAEFVLSQAPMITWESYPQSREYLMGMGEELGMPNDIYFPTPDEIQQWSLDNGVMPAEGFEIWKNQHLTALDDQLKRFQAVTQRMVATKGKWSSPQKGIDEQGNPVVYRVGEGGKIDILQGIKPEPKKGLKVYDSNGNLIVDTTGGPGQTLTKKVQGAIEEKLLGAKEQYRRMTAIANEFKPEYQEIGKRLSAAWTGIKSRLGKGVSEEDQKFLADFKRYQRRAIENINLYIKELTGAQMSEKEATRLRLAQPDPGEHWWQGDDPITFKSKMDDVLLATRAAIARFEYYRQKGLGDDEITAMINADTAVSLESIMQRMR